jgi:opacity protein-like surface antigen
VTRPCSFALAVLALIILVPGASHAQVRRPPNASSGKSQLTIRGFGDTGVTVFWATKSFTAILGRASGPLFGGGVELGLPKHLFVSVSASRFRRTGHRVFVFEEQVFTLNDSATITITPLEVNAGYRSTHLKRLLPYVGGGVGWHKYEETSAHSTDADDVHATYAGYQVLGGAEVPLQKWIAVAGEAEFASVPSALGKDSTGVSSVYSEHDLGGFTLRVKVVVGR